MPTTVPIPFWSTTNEARSKTVSGEKLVNWYLEKSKFNAKYPYALYPTPGLLLKATIGTGPHRGAIALNDHIYLVSGTTLYKVDSSYNYTALGTISGYGNVRMVVSDSQILISTNNDAYCVSSDLIYSIPIGNVCGVAYQDGYGIATQRNTQFFYISALDDLTSWTPGTDYSSADALGDNLVGCASIQRMLWLFKEKTIEFWANTGNANFPFERIQGGFIELGCLASQSIAVAGNRCFWLGNDYQVYMAVGFEPRIISTAALTQYIESRTSPQTATAFVYSQAGHTFYGLFFSDATLVYDVNEDSWHFRKTQSISRWAANSYVGIWNKDIVGDYSSGNLYELSLTTYSDNGSEIIREAYSAPLASMGNKTSMHELFIDMEMGTGLDGSGQGSDPLLMLAWSDDGGNTFGNTLTMSTGKIGEYTKQLRFNRLGSFRQRCIKISFSDPVEAIITGAFARLEPCDV